MNLLKRLFSRRLHRELSEEIQAHLDEKVDELMADGMSREEAVLAARREFGNLLLIEESSREVWGWPSMESLFLDIRQGLRALRHNPVFTAVALLTIAIGIAANTAVFTVVNSVLLKPLNYPRAEELVALHQVAPGAEGLADFENWTSTVALDVCHVLRPQPDIPIVRRVDRRHGQRNGFGGTGTAAHSGAAHCLPCAQGTFS